MGQRICEELSPSIISFRISSIQRQRGWSLLDFLALSAAIECIELYISAAIY